MFSVRTFPCPACGQFINSDAQVCRHCNAPIDAQSAYSAAALQERVDKACNSASNIRNAAGVIWIAFLLRFIPFISIVGWVGFIGLSIVVPVRIAIWWIQYGSVQTQDADFKKAKRNVVISILIWLPAGVLMLLAVFILVRGF